MMSIERISIVGYGNVGRALSAYFSSRGIIVEQVVVRKVPHTYNSTLPFLVNPDCTLLKPVDMVLVCVNDSVVDEVIQAIPSTQFVAYTSGSIKLEELQRKENIGVFYPLQTFSGEVIQNMPHIPILIESNDTGKLKLMKQFAEQFFNSVSTLSSTDREKLHLAAVFVNNFTNHLYHLAFDYLATHQLDFELLKPLIQETVSKLHHFPPYEAQTGPARRNDDIILAKQQAMLTGVQLELYKLFTQSIKETYAEGNNRNTDKTHNKQ